ncbi:Fur family transcriptional regulator [Streptomyces afghaniensis]|uniref:Fur family transcriptional regulator n=1 Tax=Streptomyces afghaniensis TaxID=66865 RepID=UPI002785ED39|nr:transcriptional repressor [Streptomyces afghaniensis]MDQ1015257.1 Fe2+ or Zn2+ uptake regulation protein [Streptomyces afghaniensis]
MGEAEESPAVERFHTPGLRSTWQRRAVLDTLGRCHEFVSAQELHALLADSGSTVGLTTVYRTLRELDRAGVVDVVRDEGGERLYLGRPAGEHRHYLICRRCGRSRPVDAETVEEWAARLAETTGYTELEHTLELSGVCGPCGHGPTASSCPPPRPAGRSAGEPGRPRQDAYAEVGDRVGGEPGGELGPHPLDGDR